MGESKNWCEEDKAHEYDLGARNTLVDTIDYNHHISLIQTLPNSSNQSPPQPCTNDPISDSGCTGHYLDSLKTIVHTRDPSEKPINVKLPNSYTKESTHQAQIPLHNLSIQVKHS